MPIVFGPTQINIKLILAKTITKKGLGVVTPIAAGICVVNTLFLLGVLANSPEHLLFLFGFIFLLVLLLLLLRNLPYPLTKTPFPNLYELETLHIVRYSLGEQTVGVSS